MKNRIALATITAFTVAPAFAASLTLGPRTLVSTNNANFNLSVFPGSAGYDDSGNGPATLTNVFGDGTVLDYNFVGNAGSGSALTTYASGGAGRTPTPVAAGTPPLTNGNGEDWVNVWTVTDPMGFTTVKDHNPTGVAGAANTFARVAELNGTVDVSGLATGQVYFPHGTFLNQWSLTLTMTGPGQTPLVAADAQTANGPAINFGWITEFNFDTMDGLYDTISYVYDHGDRDASPGSRARFMGVILDGAPIPEPSRAILLSLGMGLILLRRNRRS